jgi:hypothetical protein
MRYYILFFGLFLTFFSLSAQDEEIKRITSFPNPSIILNWGYNSWTSVPQDMSISPMSMEVDIYGMYPLIGKESAMSLAVGGGLSIQNIKSNCSLYSDDDTLFFSKIPNNLSYKTNKLSTVFFDVPIEIRIRTRPSQPNKSGIVRKRNFRLALGFKIGYIIQSYTKYDGDVGGNTDNTIKYKEYRIKNILPYRYGVYGRLGYGKFAAYLYYGISTVFDTKKGLQTQPYAIGITINI